MKDHIRHAMFHILVFFAMFVYSVRTGPWWFAVFTLVVAIAFFPITEDRLETLKRNLIPVTELHPFQQRVVEEKAELDTKIEALAKFIDACDPPLCLPARARAQSHVSAVGGHACLFVDPRRSHRPFHPTDRDLIMRQSQVPNIPKMPCVHMVGPPTSARPGANHGTFQPRGPSSSYRTS
jgi:hypothetical protein